jgi:hypothetical protein
MYQERNLESLVLLLQEVNLVLVFGIEAVAIYGGVLS